MTELKPCPCCGCDSWLKRGPTAQGMVAYQCKGCGLQSRFGTESIVIDDLNKRVSPWIKIEFLDDLPIETDLLFHNGVDTFQSWVNVCVDTGANYIVDDEKATHWMPLPEAPEIE